MTGGGLRRYTRTLRFRIVAALLAVLVAMVGTQAYVASQQAPISRSLHLIADGYLPLSKHVARIARDHQRVERDLRRIIRDRPRPLSGNQSAVRLFTEELSDTLAIARARVEMLQTSVRDPQELAALHKIGSYFASIQRAFEDYDAASDAFLRLTEAGETEEAKSYQRSLRSIGQRLGDDVQALERELDKRIGTTVRQTERAQERTTTVAGVAGLVVLVFSASLMAAAVFALRPIGELTTEVQRLAAGDYEGRVEVVGRGDEVGVLAAEFNAMSRAIASRDRELSSRAEQLDRLSRHLVSVVDSLGDPLLVVEDGRVTRTNRAARDELGAGADAAPPPLVADVLGEPGRHERAHGGQLFEVRIAPFGDAGAVAVVADITEQTRDKERLARSERLALIGQMLAQITHEVRNPLNALSLNAELLGDELEALDPERRAEAWEILAMIAGEVERLTDVTAHYLQLARRPPARLEPVDLSQLLEDIHRLLEPELAQQDVTLALKAPALPDQSADGNQLRQAMLNIIRNAVEAGAKHLDVALEATPGGIRIVVRDDGPGMSPDEIERSTDPFFSTKASGTGLGLAITRQIVEDHDGQVRVDSRPGEGTSVSLVLPHRPAGPTDAPDAMEQGESV